MKNKYAKMTESELKEVVATFISACYGQGKINDEASSLHFKMCKLVDMMQKTLEKHIKNKIEKREREIEMAKEQQKKADVADHALLQKIKEFNNDQV